MIGWIDRLWVLENPVAPAIFESSLRRFQEWGPVGWAFEYINERYIELAAELSYLQDDLEFGGQADESPLADVWAGMHTLRMAIFGYPAARLPVRGPLFKR